MHTELEQTGSEARESMLRLIDWANRFEADFNENIPGDDPVPDDFALSDAIAPDDMTVGDLRRLREVCRAILRS